MKSPFDSIPSPSDLFESPSDFRITIWDHHLRYHHLTPCHILNIAYAEFFKVAFRRRTTYKSFSWIIKKCWIKFWIFWRQRSEFQNRREKATSFSCTSFISPSDVSANPWDLFFFVRRTKFSGHLPSFCISSLTLVEGQYPENKFSENLNLFISAFI